ncbi:hypothetical protein GCM10011514_04050 [Emticicia aquatilis]|uniref:Uncharacterized protein n=1 Tax=Emticicia aquatilis TaxID=1537369 RepID=A0A916YG24_9BACT|nr:hypothetical protein [Emticicia aquatilis]GGD43276.1 hypothetical protein GCM10011514_04050 [Emticicia aquatilis]
MTKYRKIQTLIIILIATVLSFGCKEENHIDKYEVNVDSLKTLPDGFYAYRRGNIFFDNEKFMIWYTLDNSGNVKDVFRISDMANQGSEKAATINKYNIDTTANKIDIQRFIDLSRKFKFGHIKVDRLNKVSFSYRDGLSEQYVMTFIDSLKEKYSNNKDFKILTNGWFEYIDR